MPELNGNELGTEGQSSVEITLNYKGEAQVKVKAYQGTSQDEMNEIKAVAINTWKSTLTELGLSWS